LLGAIFWVLTLLELCFYLLLRYHAFLVPNIGAWAIRRILQSKERVDWSLFGKKNCLTQLWCTDGWFGVLGLELVVGGCRVISWHVWYVGCLEQPFFFHGILSSPWEITTMPSSL
jgi:hypothetical protein